MNHQSRTEQKIEEIVRVKLESEALRKREQELEARNLETRLSVEELREQEFEERIEEQEANVLEFNRGYFLQDVTLLDICKPETNSNGKMNLRQMRLQRRLTQEQLAEGSSKYMSNGKLIFQPVISNIENSFISLSSEEANAIAGYFEVNVEDLFKGYFHCGKHELTRRCCPETQCDEDLRIDLGKVLETLTPRQTEVIRMRYGIGDEELTLDEISEKYDLTRERIRQIEEKALKRLKHNSRSKHLRPYLED